MKNRLAFGVEGLKFCRPVSEKNECRPKPWRVLLPGLAHAAHTEGRAL